MQRKRNRIGILVIIYTLHCYGLSHTLFGTIKRGMVYFVFQGVPGQKFINRCISVPEG